MAELCGLSRAAVTTVGETSLAELKTRPDYAVTVHNLLVGFIEVKAPGKGADPRRFRDRHDKQQWEKLQSFLNLMYTDGNEFSLWRNGDLAGSVIRLIGDVEIPGPKLDAPPSLAGRTPSANVSPTRARDVRPAHHGFQRSAPRIPIGGAIPQQAGEMPDSIDYDANNQRLVIGRGFIEGVTPGMWSYEVSGKQVLRQWFSYRKANRGRLIIGDRRPPSALGNIQPDHWIAEYTSELLNVLHVLGYLIDLEATQADLLEQICSAPTIAAEELQVAGALEKLSSPKRDATSPDIGMQMSLLDE